MARVQLVLTYDDQSGAIQVAGPIQHMLLAQGMLAEAKRIVERLADERDRAQSNGGGPPKILVPTMLPPNIERR